MTGNGFVIRHAAESELRHPIEPSRKKENAGTRAVGRWRDGSGCVIRFLKVRIGLRDHVSLRTFVKKQSRALLSIAEDRIDIPHDLFTALLRSRIGVGQIGL